MAKRKLNEFEEELVAARRVSTLINAKLEIANVALIKQLNILYAPEIFCKSGFVEKCCHEQPEMLPFLKMFEKIHSPVPPGLWGVMEDIKGEAAVKPASATYDRARLYYLLRRMVEISGGDPGINMLETLELSAMRQEFEREDKRKGGMLRGA